MFGLMLATSYAWYSYEGGSTTFDGVTKSEDLLISYQNGEYINTSIAVPVSEEQVDMYSEKNNFNIRVTGNDKNEEIKVSVKLIDVEIADELKDANFKVEMYYQGFQRASFSGTEITTGTDINFGSVMLDNDISNQFEIRVYILDDGTDQNDMMNRIFKGKIEIEVMSRLKPVMTGYGEGADIYISGITIDGESSDSLPTKGYYNMTSSCDMGSVLSWDPLSKTITYGSGSYVNDSCSLVFTKATSTIKLSDMPVGSYVKYSGSNGCDGKHCQGDNANYVSDTDMGYCSNSNYKFITNGWRIAYKQNGSAYLVSAGAPECVATFDESKSTSRSTVTLSSSRKYGSGYEFNSSTGKFTLTNVVTNTWGSSTYQNILDSTPYTCNGGGETCTSLYELSGFYNNSIAYYYSHSGVAEVTNGVPLHLGNLDKHALKYCNPKYAKGGVCDSTTAWAMDAIDFQKITGSQLSKDAELGTFCFASYSTFNCGYNNDLIDNGGVYWIASPHKPSSSNYVFFWDPNERVILNSDTDYFGGIRPILHLDSSVVVTGGSGTYKDPYTISLTEND